MPTYQYACTSCASRLEVVQSFTDAPLTECASCGGALRKVFSPVGVVFKGSGFYRTDSRREGGATKRASSSTTSSGTAEGSGTGAAGSATGAPGSASPSSPAKADPAPAGRSSPSTAPASGSVGT